MNTFFRGLWTGLTQRVWKQKDYGDNTFEVGYLVGLTCCVAVVFCVMVVFIAIMRYVIFV